MCVPASSSRFLTKARTIPADVILLDLEDAVASDAKATARTNLVAALGEGEWAAPTVTVRINSWASGELLSDLEAVVQAESRLAGVVLPKVHEAVEVTALDLVLDQLERRVGWRRPALEIEAQIENPKALAACSEIVGASPRLRSLVFGPGDFMAALGMPRSNIGGLDPRYPGDPLHHVRSSMLLAAKAQAVAAIEGPFVLVEDEAGFRAAVERAAALGFDGIWTIHPSQVAIANEAFTPGAEQLAHARQVVAAAEEAEARGAGALRVAGEMVDAAGVALARSILARNVEDPAN